MMRRSLTLFAAIAVVTVSSNVLAQQDETPEVPVLPSDEKPPETPHQAAPPSEVRAAPRWTASSEDVVKAEGPARHDLIRVNAGLRVGYLRSTGFDTFAKNDVLSQFSLDATFPIFSTDKLVLGVGLGWDIGGRSDALRGQDTSLSTHRFYVPVEGRYALLPWLHPFLKLAPGAAVAIAKVHESTLDQELSATGWAFSADASVGASILLGPRKHMERRTPRVWLTPEIGYSLTTAAKLSAETGRDEANVLGSDERTNLRSLALSGLFWRASVGMTF